jgi:putative spermidine/putrescine transport system substrate-binding protein
MEMERFSRLRGRLPAAPWAPPARSVLCATLALLAALAAALGVAACGGSSSTKTTLTIGGWGAPIDEATQKSYLTPFGEETKTGARFVDAPAEQQARVEAQNNAKKIEWDALDSVGGGAAYALAAAHDLAPLPASTKVELERELTSKYVTPWGFAHGNLGYVIVCNTAKMTTCPANTTQFFDTKAFPQSRMFGGIEPIEEATEAEVAEGMPISQTATAPVDVKAVIKTLERLKPTIKVFWQSGEQQQQALRSGQVDMGIIWSDRAYQLIEQGMHLKIVWAQGVYEPSYWAVLAGAPHEQAAFKLLSWIAAHPKNEAQWAKEIHISVPNPKALEYLPQSFADQLVDNPINYNQLAVPNFAWYAQHGTELNTAYENFLRG